MHEIFKRHWPFYLMEAWGLATFMSFASLFATLLEYPGSPLRRALPEPSARFALLGLGMGLVVAGIVYSPWGKKSGAHINPAVTWAFFRLGKIGRADAIFYTLAQFAGATCAVQLMRVLIGAPYHHESVKYVATIPGPDGPLAAFAAEFLISLALMIAVLFASNDKRLEKWAGALIGVILMAYLALETPFSGMSLNPARSFGSALASGEWKDLWVYFTAPPLAMLLGSYVYTTLLRKPLTGANYPVEKKEENDDK